jgi:Protein of unknown function (DUF2794)
LPGRPDRAIIASVIVGELMSETTPPQQSDGPWRGPDAEANKISLFRRSSGANPQRPAPHVVSFDRRELSEILNLYGRMVAAGEWRDYAIDFTPDRAVFSIFRRASETPLFRVEKDPASAKRQGAYSVVAATGRVLKRGQDLSRVIRVLDKRPGLVVV